MPQLSAVAPLDDGKAPASETSAPSTSRHTRRSHSRKIPKRSASGSSEKLLNEDRSKGRGGSVIFTVLVVGLVFSLVDVFYMIHVVHRDKFHPNQSVRVADTAMHETTNDAKEEVPKTPQDIARGKEEIFDLIKRANLDPYQLDAQTISELPTWEEVVGLYGPKPVIHGLDQCERFQDFTHRIGFVGSAGTFNSGTNLMAELVSGPQPKGILSWQPSIIPLSSFCLFIYLCVCLLTKAHCKLSHARTNESTWRNE
jgi:hypothetical protein